MDVRADLFETWQAKQNPPKDAAMTASERKAFFDALVRFEQSAGGRGRQRSAAMDTADIVRLAYLFGRRTGEIKSARWGQIDLDTGFWSLDEEGRQQRTSHEQALDVDSIEIIKRIRARRERRRRGVGPDDFVFPSNKTKSGHRESIWWAFQTILQMSGINDGKPYENQITPHAMHTSRITELIEEHGWAPSDVAEHLGVTEAVVSGVYHRPDQRKKSLARARSLGSSGLALGV